MRLPIIPHSLIMWSIIPWGLGACFHGGISHFHTQGCKSALLCRKRVHGPAGELGEDTSSKKGSSGSDVASTRTSESTSFSK